MLKGVPELVNPGLVIEGADVDIRDLGLLHTD